MPIATAAQLGAALDRVPDTAIFDEPAALTPAIDALVAELAGPATAASLARDPYWPKWDSPWWRMLLLAELGHGARIPTAAIDALVASLDALPTHSFPLTDDEWPPGVERFRASACHCALGCVDALLAACGVDVDAALPWIAAWYARYQLADGGYNCDEAAYAVRDECPSSMVGTVAPLEALVTRAPSAAADRAAAMLLGRGLVRGSDTRHNAEERDAARAWTAPCFPRFYFYDTLRGLAAVVSWADAHERRLPLAAIAAVVDDLIVRFPDGAIRIERAPIDGATGWTPGTDGWRRAPTTVGALLAEVSRPGRLSPSLSRQWATTRARLRRLLARDAITATP